MVSPVQSSPVCWTLTFPNLVHELRMDKNTFYCELGRCLFAGLSFYRLPRLLTTHFPGPEYGTTEAAWKAVLNEADRRCELHLRVKDNLVNDVIQSIKNWQKDNYHKQLMQIKERKELDDQFKRAQKPWVKLLEKVEKAKSSYHIACKNEKSAVNQERNATKDSSLSQDSVRSLYICPLCVLSVTVRHQSVQCCFKLDKLHQIIFLSKLPSRNGDYSCLLVILGSFLLLGINRQEDDDWNGGDGCTVAGTLLQCLQTLNVNPEQQLELHWGSRWGSECQDNSRQSRHAVGRFC